VRKHIRTQRELLSRVHISVEFVSRKSTAVMHPTVLNYTALYFIPLPYTTLHYCILLTLYALYTASNWPIIMLMPPRNMCTAASARLVSEA
jgi:hypothetical protein